MSPEEFLKLQEQLWYAFAWPIRWWLILFLASGVLTSGFLIFVVVTRRWLDNS